jgi:hypothetical protein
MISLRCRSGMYPTDNLAPQTKQPIQHADSSERTLSQKLAHVRREPTCVFPQYCIRNSGNSDICSCRFLLVFGRHAFVALTIRRFSRDRVLPTGRHEGRFRHAPGLVVVRQRGKLLACEAERRESKQ